MSDKRVSFTQFLWMSIFVIFIPWIGLSTLQEYTCPSLPFVHFIQVKFFNFLTLEPIPS